MKKLSLVLAILMAFTFCFTGCGEKTAVPAEASRTALIVSGTEYSLAECNLYFCEQLFGLLQQYGDVASYLGLDVSQGTEAMKEQTFSYSSDGTWFGYFLDGVKDQISQVQALNDFAKSKGLSLTDDELAEIEDEMKALSEYAETNGYDSAEAYLADCYYEGITEDLYRQYLQKNYLADKAYSDYATGVSFTQTEVKEHYAEMGYEEGENDYRVTSMHHVLIMAEASEDGTYSDEAIAASRARALELYDEWSKGDRTEESFTQMAIQYSEDPGVVSNDGYYGSIGKGTMVENIDSWLFEEGRQVGDTAIIENVGSYVGTHIVYFAGYGDLYCDILSLNDLQSNAMNDWFTELMAFYSPKEGEAYDQIGLID